MSVRGKEPNPGEETTSEGHTALEQAKINEALLRRISGQLRTIENILVVIEEDARRGRHHVRNLKAVVEGLTQTIVNRIPIPIPGGRRETDRSKDE